MKQTLSDQDRGRLDGLIDETETRTKTQIVLAVTGRCDTYAELPWKAFALGAAIAGLLVFILDLPFYGWYPRISALIFIAVTLGSGAVFALLTVLIPGFAKCFLSAGRADVEVRQYAESMFLDRELFATRRRTGILMMVSLFERKVVILPDKGLGNILTKERLQEVIASMTPLLKQHELIRAFEAGLERLSHVLGDSVQGSGEDELPDEIIEEKGV
jgi:putative membrane protein